MAREATVGNPSGQTGSYNINKKGSPRSLLEHAGLDLPSVPGF